MMQLDGWMRTKEFILSLFPWYCVPSFPIRDSATTDIFPPRCRWCNVLCFTWPALIASRIKSLEMVALCYLPS